MKVLIQRVTHASVVVEGDTIGAIDRGLLAFVGIEKHDTDATLDRMAKKLISYRVFPDAEDKMNLSVSDINGGILAISQFTLAANTNKGLRPSFSTAAPPKEAEQKYLLFITKLKAHLANIEMGKFGADMKVSLLNDGPVTFLLDM